MNYLRQKVEIANGEIAILEDNLQHLLEMPELHQRILYLADRLNSIVQYLAIEPERFEEDDDL